MNANTLLNRNTNEPTDKVISQSKNSKLTTPIANRFKSTKVNPSINKLLYPPIVPSNKVSIHDKMYSRQRPVKLQHDNPVDKLVVNFWMLKDGKKISEIIKVT